MYCERYLCGAHGTLVLIPMWCTRHAGFVAVQVTICHAQVPSSPKSSSLMLLLPIDLHYLVKQLVISNVRLRIYGLLLDDIRPDTSTHS